MRIENLAFSNFRCFEDYRLGFKKGINLLFGANGSGKTRGDAVIRKYDFVLQWRYRRKQESAL